EPAGRWGGAAERWADLGCGTGTFTLALAELLGAGTIIGVDEDRQALDALPTTHAGAQIEPQQADLNTFARDDPLDGVLLANALHYVSDPEKLLRRLSRVLVTTGRLLLVEYDTDTPLRPWVPYPISHDRA